MAKVINKTITTHLTNMKDGDVAEIVNWFCKRRCADISNLYIFNLQRNSEHL